MGLHDGKNRAPRKRWSRRKKMIPLAVIGGLIASGGSAYAAITLLGFGTIDVAAAASEQGVTVDSASAKLTKTLVPGQTVGVAVNVKNPNTYPVEVSGIVVQDSSFTAPGGGDCATTVHLVGTPTTWLGKGAGAGTLLAIPKNVVIPAGATKTITAPKAVKQDASGTTLCGFHANVAVQAQTAG